MNQFGIEPLTTEKAVAELIDISGGIRLTFSGDIDLQNPEAVFMPFFDRIHDKIVASNLKEIELDFTRLTFLNSSGIKTLIQWITKVTPLPPDKKYNFKIIANSQITWQETSLRMLTMLAPGLIEMETI